MSELSTPFVHLPGVLSSADVRSLADACKNHLRSEGMPCFVLLDRLDSEPYGKIKGIVEKQLGESVFYLNDFYIYTDKSFRTSWHMDTELFTFASAVNAWILLSPESVADPLGFIDEINDRPDRQFHNMRIKGKDAVFGEYFAGNVTKRAVEQIEKTQHHTPTVGVGDILLLNPRRFHRTNVETPKHVFAIKFLMRGNTGFLADTQVPDFLWPEVATFNALVAGTSEWDEVLDRLRQALKDPAQRKELISGFYPDKFPLYQRMSETL